jgi:hypothetical protein
MCRNDNPKLCLTLLNALPLLPLLLLLLAGVGCFPVIDWVWKRGTSLLMGTEVSAHDMFHTQVGGGGGACVDAVLAIGE